MYRSYPADAPLVDRVFEELRGWRALRECRADCGGGRALAVGASQVLHLHGGEAVLRLTWPVIRRMGVALLECAAVKPGYRADWVRIRLDGDGDVRLLVALVSVAIKANAFSAHEPGAARSGSCLPVGLKAGWEQSRSGL
ncbi:hypothetical protein [Actinoallomurus acanthiterrae]